MLRLFALLCALVFANAATATPSNGPQLFVNAPSDGFLNLRSGPSTRYQVIDKMQHRSRVTLLAQPGAWAKVYHHKSDTIGWAHGRFLSHEKPAKVKHQQAQSIRWVDAPYGDLNLRKGPGTGYHILREIHNGMKVEVLGRSDSWRLVRLESGLLGWAHADFLAKHPPHNQPPAQPPHRPHSDLQTAWDACEHLQGRAFRGCLSQRLPSNR